ncbi:MAG TPA: M56 family metallopeptidase [Mucilaginibacter sp.]|nr:M56 family metallopeptidase [Mucilaginibacter sp.]
MNLFFVKILPDNLMQALCDTLLHSLWQGLILSGLTAAIIVFTRKSSPSKRYNLLIGALMLFAAATVCTFALALKHTGTATALPVINHHYTAPVVTQVQTNYLPPVQKTTFTDSAIDYLNRNSATIVLIWFLIVCVRCLQLATGIQGIYYLKHRSIFKADEFWIKRLLQLANELGIRHAVRIAESGLAKVPMVIGHLKPLILIPAGLFTALPPEEIEAILIHELAHIRRADYLVNLMQSLLEILFFFNPAVLWVSALIKTERENCCDDIAVSRSSNKVNYIKALVSCQEFNASSPALAMALKGNKNHLKNRVTRIISNNNQSLNRIEKSLLAICLGATCLLAAAFTNAEKINKLVDHTVKVISHDDKTTKKEKTGLPPEPVNVKKEQTGKADSISNKLRVFKPAEIGNNTSMTVLNGPYISQLYKENGTLYQLNYRQKLLTSMQVNGKTIPNDKIPAYHSVIERIPNDSPSGYGEVHDAADDRAKAATQADVTPYYPDNNYQKALSRTDSALVSLKAQNSKITDKLNALGIQGKLNLLKDQRIADSITQAYKKEHSNYVKSAKNAYDPKSYIKSGSDYNKTPYTPETSEYKPYSALKDNERTDRMITELISDGIITTKDNLSFKISTSEFIVNGKKQPDAIYQKYKSRYVKNTNGEWSWMYNYDESTKRESNSVVNAPKD